MTSPDPAADAIRSIVDGTSGPFSRYRARRRVAKRFGLSINSAEAAMSKVLTDRNLANYRDEQAPAAGTTPPAAPDAMAQLAAPDVKKPARRQPR